MDGKYKYRFTALAYEDIDSVLEYISTKLENPTAAADLFDRMEAEVQKCRDYPFSYPDCKHFVIDDTNYRHINIGNYTLFFRVKEEEHVIEILRFLYSGRDFSQIPIDE